MSFKLKIALVFSAVTAVLLAVTWGLVTHHITQKVVRQLGDKLTGIAIVSALSINGDAHESVAQARRMDTPAYRSLRRDLQRVQRATKGQGVTNVYTLRRTGEPYRWEFIFDANDADDSAPLGKVYDVSDLPELKRAFNGPIADTRVYRDEWGDWLSGYAPIRNKSGDAVAVLGLDASAATVKEAQRRVLRDLLVLLVISVLVVFPVSFLVGAVLAGPIRKLVAATRAIGDGNFDARVDIRSRDELGALGASFNAMAAGLRERDFIKQTFSKYLSREVAEKVMGAKLDEILAGERRHVTVVFTDVRGFTQLSEHMRPEELLKVLNEYFRVMIDVVLEFGGNLDKFLGDGLMAVFGAPVAHGDDAERAVRAAIKMQEGFAQLNERRARDGAVQFSIGIGINTGTAVAGNVGSDKRREYSVIGDTVNLASRVQSLAGSNEIMITQSTYDEIQDLVTTEKLPPQPIKGKSADVQVYKVLSIH